MNTWKEMETRSAVPVRTLNVKQRCNFGSSGIFPSSLPVMANTFVERFPKLSDPQQVPMETEMMGDVLAFQYTPFVSNGGNIGPMYSSPSGISPDHFSSVLSHERNRDNAPFVRQLGNAEVSLPSAYSPYTETFQVPINNLSNDPTEVTWCPDSVQGSLNYSHDEITGTTQSRQIVVPDDDLNTQDEWWSGVTNEDWKELLKDTIAAESQLQVVYPNPTSTTPLGISVYGSHNHQSIPRHSNELGAVTSQLPAATTAARPRMRWSLELHERFVDAVNQLGGSEKATPKGILNIMKVEGLTICHVKSHLQKFRTACYRPHPSEGMPEKKTTESEDLPFLNLKTGLDFTEALRIQMEVQKRLHEQLEEQRELQLQIEKQGRYLQKIIEKQCKSTTEKFHASSTMEEPTTDETASAAKVVHPAAGTSCSIDSNITEGRQVGDKRKMPEFEPSVDNETNVITASPPQHKHAKISNGDNDDELQQQLAVD